jgi:hypothetical protein
LNEIKKLNQNIELNEKKEPSKIVLNLSLWLNYNIIRNQNKVLEKENYLFEFCFFFNFIKKKFQNVLNLLNV